MSRIMILLSLLALLGSSLLESAATSHQVPASFAAQSASAS